MESASYRVVSAVTGEAGLSLAASVCPEIILLDLGLPDMDGVDVIAKLRIWTTVPIIVISARSKEQDKVQALDLGADDYITKPFGSSELLARIRTSLRHAAIAASPSTMQYRAGDLTVDYEKHVGTLKGRGGASDPDRI